MCRDTVTPLSEKKRVKDIVENGGPPCFPLATHHPLLSICPYGARVATLTDSQQTTIRTAQKYIKKKKNYKN